MASQLPLCNRMDIARPEFKTQKCRRQTIIVAAVVSGVAAVSGGVSRLKPAVPTLRELALSYFNGYFKMRGERRLRRFARTVSLKRFDRQQWMITDKLVWFIVYHLFDMKHYSLFTSAQEKRLHRVDERLFQAECLEGHWLAGSGSPYLGSPEHPEGTPCPLAT
jgi:hypothetical protein